MNLSRVSITEGNIFSACEALFVVACQKESLSNFQIENFQIISTPDEVVSEEITRMLDLNLFNT